MTAAFAPAETSATWSGRRSLDPVLPGMEYDGGFLKADRLQPFYSFSQPDAQSHWSDDMTDFIAESSKDHFIDRYNRQLALQGIRPALEKQNPRYIDIGCSSGYMLEDLVQSYPKCQVFGSDFFAGGLINCHKVLPQIPLLQMDITQCPLGDQLFDAMTCLNVLEHISDDAKALTEIRRLLKPGGRLSVTVPAAPNLFDLYDEVHQHVRRYTAQDLRQKLLAAGFQISAMNYFGVIIYPLFYLRKKMNRLLYSGLPFEEKMRKARALATSTVRLKTMEMICRLESSLGAHVPYPFGIRLYAVVTRPS